VAEGAGGRLERWLSIGGSIIAPASAITALLFYFGYVSSRAQYDYFGVDVDLVGLTTQDYVMRSPQPLLVPLLVITLACALLLGAHTLVRRRVTERDRLGGLARRTVVAGLALLVAGVLLLFLYPLLQDWADYPLMTPLVLVAGGSLTGWGLMQLRRLDAEAVAAEGGTQRGAVDALEVAIVLVWVAVVAGVFWLTATIADWSGRGLGKEQARELRELPSVILDTKERLFLPAGMGVAETQLEPAEDGQAFRYRYWNLRLLVEGKDAMFLVPNDWDAANTTLLVPVDGNVRVRFQFRNDPP
jgi:hypothetical protein